MKWEEPARGMRTAPPWTKPIWRLRWMLLYRAWRRHEFTFWVEHDSDKRCTRTLEPHLSFPGESILLWLGNAWQSDTSDPTR